MVPARGEAVRDQGVFISLNPLKSAILPRLLFTSTGEADSGRRSIVTAGTRTNFLEVCALTSIPLSENLSEFSRRNPLLYHLHPSFSTTPQVMTDRECGGWGCRA